MGQSKTLDEGNIKARRRKTGAGNSH